MNPFFIRCIFVGLMGTVLSTLSVVYSLQKKAKAANVIFNFGIYLKTDWYSPVISFVALLLAYAFLPYIPATLADWMVLIIFSTIGYTGNDLVSRFFSTVNTRINAAIDFKTTIADASNPDPKAPTPAAPIQPKP